jgi:DNA helicase-2/ATP-dependent DNA helicase PcrA
MRVQDVLDCALGSIVAPAGCGKTHLIIETLSVKFPKPILVLTHTTAGVAALKKRLGQMSVPTSHYVVTTIDGWALKLASSFPESCPINSSPENPRSFYPEIRLSVLRFLVAGGINEIISSSYSRLLVDEYQDCDINQHNLVTALSEMLPTVIFGDPMQCIFNFAGPMPDWNNEVLQRFPLISSLKIPWRWNNVGAPMLGEWILDVRELLQQSKSIDLLSCPGHVVWQQLTGVADSDLTNQLNAQHSILNRYPTDSLLIIGSSMNERSRHNYAQGNSTIEVVEPVQLANVTNAANHFDQTTGIGLTTAIIEFTSTMMTNVDVANTSQRIESILNGHNLSQATISEQALCNTAIDGTRSNILVALQQLELKSGTHVYRNAAYTALKDAISLSVTSPEKSMFEAASTVRERLRHQGDRRIPNRAIGSTLLLKGLEADHSLILDAQTRGMTSKHLYVALSRGAKTVTVFSRNAKIN